MTTMVNRATKGSELSHGEMDANLERDVDVKTTTYAALVSDNRTTLECNHATTPFTVTLGDAATMAAADTGDYEITIANIGAAAVTVSRAGSDTIDGAATSVILAQYSSVTLKVNAATDGYNSVARGLGGLTSTAAELNILDGVTSTTAELNILDGALLTVAELNYVNGVTSAIQSQIDTKAPVADPTFTGEIGIGAVNVSETELGILEGASLTTAELNYVNGVTSAVQTQIDSKAASSHGHVGGDITNITEESITTMADGSTRRQFQALTDRHQIIEATTGWEVAPFTEWVVPRTGTYTLVFDMRDTNATTDNGINTGNVQARFYKNAATAYSGFVATGTTQSEGDGNWLTKTQTGIALNAGDVVALFVDNNTGPRISIRNVIWSSSVKLFG